MDYKKKWSNMILGPLIYVDIIVFIILGLTMFAIFIKDPMLFQIMFVFLVVRCYLDLKCQIMGKN